MTTKEKKHNPKQKKRMGTLRFVVLMLLLSLFISVFVKHLVETRGQKIFENWKDGLDPAAQSSPRIEKGRGFDNSKDDETIEALVQEIREDPQNADLYNKLGNRYLFNEKFDRAIEAFDKAITMNPSYAEPYNGKGIAYRNLSEYSEAIANYTKAIELYPSFLEAYNNRGVSFMFLGEYKEMCLDFNKACDFGSCEKLEASRQRGLCE